MKYHAIAVLLFVSALAPAASEVDFSITVHVSATRMVREGGHSAYQQRLNVVIEGKKCELESLDMPNALLELGDYKARLAKVEHWGGHEYDSWKVYELLLPDRKTRKFLLVGLSE